MALSHYHNMYSLAGVATLEKKDRDQMLEVVTAVATH